MPMPFYIPGKQRPRVVIVGGGYAGLSALVTLRRYRADAEITLIDPRPHHLKITRLHESFRHPPDTARLPFQVLEQRFAIRHLQRELVPDIASVRQWQADRAMVLDDEVLEFDYLLLATGAGIRNAYKTARTLDLDDFMAGDGPALLEQHLGSHQGPHLTVVGGGASGIQFLFEIAHYLRERRWPCLLRLVDAESAPLAQFPPELGRYVLARLHEQAIDYLPERLFRGQEDGRVLLEARHSGEFSELPSDLALLFLGKTPEVVWDTNWFGQVKIGSEILARVFAAGDCAHYPLPGANAQSAQTALRKGKLAARNILRHGGTLPFLEPYLHRDVGYVVSLGPRDAVGWLALERNVVAGLPATVVKELVEAQYDLLLAGVDTYLL